MASIRSSTYVWKSHTISAQEFFIWEFATAVAGWRIGINPFDQPNVQEAKDATKELLNAFERRGHLDPRVRDR